MSDTKSSRTDKVAAPVEPVMTDEQRAADEQAKAAAAAEAAKQKRAADGVTGSPNGDLAATAFGARIEAARFEHRNQGHDDTMALLDEMLAALQRLEAKTGATG